MTIYTSIVIGAGPAGVATATELINKGISPEAILVLERSSQVSNMVQTKYPDEKPVLANYKGKNAECIGELCITDMTKQDFQSYLQTKITEKSIQVVFNQEVKKIIKLKNGQWNVVTSSTTYLCNSVFVAIGNMSAPRTLDAAIESGAQNLIHNDLQNISPALKNILVVGGGDTASEYAQILSSRGHGVTLSYRKDTFSRMLPQNHEKLEELIKTGLVHFLPSSSVLKVTKTPGGVHVAFDNAAPIEVQGIVTALGSERPLAYLEKLGISLKTEAGEKYVENEKGGLFYIGDLASGVKGGSINLAFDSATEAVGKACTLYLDCRE
jgi:thioredoxin reductase (NADPH)